MNKFFIITNGFKDKELKITNQLTDYIIKKGASASRFITSLDEIEKASIDPKLIDIDTQVIIVLGGDGTLIRAARDLVTLKVPLIGVNMGTLGYLCELNEHTVFDGVDKIMEGKYEVEERLMLQGVMKTKEDVLVGKAALNDVVIHRVGSLQMIRMKVHVNGEYLTTYDADGIIISTPTGSTGYSMSAGGPIVDPKASLMLITPISPHTLNTKSIVISPDDHITIEIVKRHMENEDAAVVSFDGDNVITLEAGEVIEISKAPKTAEILKIGKQSFLQILQKKMQVYDELNIT